MKGISDLSSALMEYELDGVQSLQSQAATDTLSACESSFGTAETCMSQWCNVPRGHPTVVCVREKETERLKKKK